MDHPDDNIRRLPKPPRIPRPLPYPSRRGWWISPGYDPRVVRYHDGNDWTEFECRLGLRGPGPVVKSEPPVDDVAPAPLQPPPSDDPEINRLPPLPNRIINLLDIYTPESGWFWDPDIPGHDRVRYWEGFKWTEFVCEMGEDGPGPIHRLALPPWHN